MASLRLPISSGHISLPFQLTDVNTHIEEERKVTREVREQLGLTDRRCNAMAGELEESKALLEAAIRCG